MRNAQNLRFVTNINKIEKEFFIPFFIFLFLSEPQGGPKWTPTVGDTFNPVPQFRLIHARTGSARKG